MEKKLRRRNKVWGIFLFGVYVTTWRLVREPYVKERERGERRRASKNKTFKNQNPIWNILKGEGPNCDSFAIVTDQEHVSQTSFSAA